MFRKKKRIETTIYTKDPRENVQQKDDVPKEETPKDTKPRRQVVIEKQTYCQRHPKVCNAAKIAGVGALAGALVVSSGGLELIEAPIDMAVDKGAEKYKKVKRNAEIRRTSEKALEEFNKKQKSAKKKTGKKASPKKKSTTKKTASKKSTVKKSQVKKRTTTKKRTPKDDNDYWRIDF